MKATTCAGCGSLIRAEEISRSWVWVDTWPGLLWLCSACLDRGAGVVCDAGRPVRISYPVVA